jgi:hypothetical protein
LSAAFYCVADRRYFPGAAAMLNSLRLQGHDEPVFLLDCGLTPEQRETLDPQVTVIPAPADTPPYLLKTVAPLAHPAEVMVLIDADMIVTRPLTELLDRAAAGRVVAFKDRSERFVPEWGELLGLGRASRQPYVCSGLVLAGGAVGGEVLGLMHERQTRVDFGRTFYGENDPGYPFRFPEQDVLNAILCSAVDGERLVAIEHRLAPTPPWSGLRVIDERALRCAYGDGVEPYVVHHHGPKPWLDPTHHGVYSRLLRRSLLGEDVPLRVPERALPRRLRRGPLAYAARKWVNARWLLRWYVRHEPVASPPETHRGRADGPPEGASLGG